jgi:excisionase family DNA binding protein
VLNIIFENMIINKFYKESEIAKRLRISLPTLGKLRKKNEIDFIKIGDSIRYPDHVFNGIMKMPNFNQENG